MVEDAKTQSLEGFIQWVAAHITGDEKGEAQVFLDRLFQGFGWDGLREAGATCEERIKKTDGGTSFADLVWKPIVVIEMKKRGENLNKHYRQAFTYWTQLVPNRPRYAVLCNFDEFWIYDFETQLDTPVDKIAISELSTNYGALNFLFPGDVPPIFGNHHESVTRQAADKLAVCFNQMTARGVDNGLAQRFILQILMALFAEDIGLLEKYLVAQIIEDCKTPQDSHDLIGGLFQAMNTPGGVTGGRFKGVAYFNGGLFSEPAFVELTIDEIELLKEASVFDWSKVRPEIFGTIFEHSLGKEERHARGAHFTSAVDIMKVILPTIVGPWSSAIESAKTLGQLKSLLAQIENFKILDPACGSGNFLYIAYREMKRLEARIYERMASDYKSVDPNQRPFGFVSARNFFGMDINSFAVDIAKVTMMLAHKLSIDELHINETALPLDNLDDNFKTCDALIDDSGKITPWFQADVIIGNPPFLGAKLLKPAYGDEYVRKLRAAYPEVPGMADLCVYWLNRAQKELPDCSPDNPFSGRAGLVGTQNIRNNASRRGGLESIAADGTIVEAVDNQPWSGEANVHVSIVNWVKSKNSKLMPSKRRLWFAVKPKKTQQRRPRGAGSAAKDYELDMAYVDQINSALSGAVDVSGAHQLSINDGYCYTGQYPRYNTGFVLSIAEGKNMLSAAPKNSDVVRLFAGGRELLGNGKADRFVIDFQERSLLQAQTYRAPFKHIEKKVLPYVEDLAATERAKTKKSTGQDQAWLNSWWRFFRYRPELISKIEEKKRYLVCSRVTKRPIMMFLSSDVRPSDALTCFVFDDDYSFGVLQSEAHYSWFHAKCSNMKSDPRYTSESIFNTFPWPQNPSKSDIDAVCTAAREISNIRSDSEKNGIGLRELYSALELPGKNALADAHEKLNKAVLKAYGFTSKKDVLSQLLDLNFKLAEKLESNQAVSGPGIPESYKNPGSLVSVNCFK